jgi:DinB superfamily
MSDPMVTAADDMIRESVAGLREAIAGLPAEGLNWRPGGEDTNPIAVLVVHGLQSTRSWLAVAFGERLPERDRDAEFVTVAESADVMLAFVDRLDSDCRALLDVVGTFEPGTQRESHVRTSTGEAEVVTGAWALLHAVEHLSEHVAQARLTRQLWERREG